MIRASDKSTRAVRMRPLSSGWLLSSPWTIPDCLRDGGVVSFNDGTLGSVVFANVSSTNLVAFAMRPTS